MHNKTLTLATNQFSIKLKVNQHTYKLFSQSRAGVYSERKFPSVLPLHVGAQLCCGAEG